MWNKKRNSVECSGCSLPSIQVDGDWGCQATKITTTTKVINVALTLYSKCTDNSFIWGTD